MATYTVMLEYQTSTASVSKAQNGWLLSIAIGFIECLRCRSVDQSAARGLSNDPTTMAMPAARNVPIFTKLSPI